MEFLHQNWVYTPKVSLKIYFFFFVFCFCFLIIFTFFVGEGGGEGVEGVLFKHFWNYLKDAPN